MASELKPSLEQPTNVRWTVFALACSTSWMLYFHRYAFALIKPELAKEWSLDTDTLGWLDFTFSACYTFPPIADGRAR